VLDGDDDCATGNVGWTSSGVGEAHGENTTDYDGDGCQDSDQNEDADDDNDGALDDADSDDNNIYECSDNDEDGCEDCSSGTYNTSDDGADDDGDGMCDLGDVDLDLHAGANAVSFFALPSNGDYSVSNIFGDDGNIEKVFGEGVVAFNSDSNGWIGYLTDVADDEGYWAILNEAANLKVTGLPTLDVEYQVHEGNNFLSYSYSDGQALLSALPDNAQAATEYIYGEGTAGINLGDGSWGGSLATDQGGFEGGKGYWFGASSNFVFEYNVPADGVAKYTPVPMPEVPYELAFKQSPHQYFYFVDEATVEGADLNRGDWIVAYNNDVIVGSRMYNGSAMIDIPIMGEDSSVQILANHTAGYCKDGDIPSIKIHRTTGEVVDMHVTAVEGSLAFSKLGHAVVSLTDALLPTEVSLHNAYPNPFNPSTMIEYEIPQGSMQVNLSIYDLRGRLVTELVNEMQQGSVQPYQVVWNAEMNASGLYFVQLTAGNTVKTQKIMLIK